MNQISLYAEDTPQNGFDNNGIAILCPSSCVVREKLNGEFSLELTHPIDEDGIWRTISAFTHIKALGQIFDVKTVSHDYTGRSGKITVYAEHVFYKMNDPWLFPESVITGNTSNDLIQSAMNAADAVPFPGSVDYTFSYDSDIPVTTGYTRTIDKGCTLAEAIIGNGGIQETFGGELYRNNFYFSLKQRMEDSQDNAFEIRVGLNMKGIKRTVDVETFCSYFRAYDHLGQWFAISYDASAYSGLPIQNSVVRSQNFSYDTDDPVVSMANLEREADFYWWKHLAPKITYEVDLRDTRNNPDFAFISNHYRFKVGDYGRIYDDRLGGALQLRITETETDALTGEVIKVVFGDLRGFVKESGDLPLPPFPVIFDETKINVAMLAENGKPTGQIAYFDTIRSAQSYMYSADSSNRYLLYIGKNAGITELAQSALASTTTLRKVRIPDSVISIGATAFQGCSNLAIIDGMNETSSIGNRAFSGCASLKSIDLPGTLVTVGSGAFSNSGLESIVIPDSVTSELAYVCEGCTDLESATIGASVSKIYTNAFKDCTSLTNVLIKDGVPEITNNSFYNCLSLTSISIPHSVSVMDTTPFAECTNLSEIIVDAKWGDVTPTYWYPPTTPYCWGAPNATITWARGYPAIKIINGSSVVKYTDNIGEASNLVHNGSSGDRYYVEISGNTVTSVGGFANSQYLYGISMNADSITTIADGACYGCYNLATVEIGASVSSIGNFSFANCTSLSTIEINQPENSIPGAPWGATNATVTWTG